jgi:hypothetical protein
MQGSCEQGSRGCHEHCHSYASRGCLPSANAGPHATFHETRGEVRYSGKPNVLYRACSHLSLWYGKSVGIAFNEGEGY